MCVCVGIYIYIYIYVYIHMEREGDHIKREGESREIRERSVYHVSCMVNTAPCITDHANDCHCVHCLAYHMHYHIS